MSVDPLSLYRLPWSLNDNVLGWLEPTKRCNLYCEGCYSRNDPDSDKRLEAIREDLDAFVSQRRLDSISIAGGDPLIHPDIVDIVRMVRHEYGLKPVINTNGLALTPELLARLVDAGVQGFTFHIDSTQGRPGWKEATEQELADLRLEYARMVREAGDVSVAFNATITRSTLEAVPDLVEWAAQHIDLVDSMVFILFRTSRAEEFDYFANGEKVDIEELVYWDQESNPAPLVASDVVEAIRARFPDFQPNAYLGGTKDPNSIKWLLSARLGAPGRIFGYVGPRYMETIQNAYHWLFGKYLGYARPSLLEHGRSMLLGFSPIDRGIRRIGRRYLGDVLQRPWNALPKLYFQSILIIQPIDMMPDGEMNMCDGCPDMTVLDGQLVWSCRLDERVQHGCFLTAAPRC